MGEFELEGEEDFSSPIKNLSLETGLVLSDYSILVNSAGIYEGLAMQLLEISYRYRAENQRLRQERSFFDREMRARGTLGVETKEE